MSDIPKLKQSTIERHEVKEGELTEIVDDLIKRIVDRQNEILEISLRTMAEPPITGKITKHKIKWRGIRLIRQLDFPKETMWLEQRGKQISPKIIFDPESHLIKWWEKIFLAFIKTETFTEGDCKLTFKVWRGKLYILRNDYAD